jgi:hypothetical protein
VSFATESPQYENLPMKEAERNQNGSERRRGEISSTEDDARFAQNLQDGDEDANDDETSDQPSIDISTSLPSSTLPKRRGRPTGSKTKFRFTDPNCRKHRLGERYAPCINLSSRLMNVGGNSGANTRSANRNRASSPANNTRMQQDAGQIKHHKRSRKKKLKDGGVDGADCEGSSKGSVGSSSEERSTSSSESRSSSVSRESRGEVSVYDDDDDDERRRTRIGRNYVSKETIIQQQIIEIRRLKENLEAYKADLQNKSTELQTSEEEKKETIKEITAVVAQKTTYLKKLEAEVEEMKAWVKEAEQRMKVFVKEAAASSA